MRFQLIFLLIIPYSVIAVPTQLQKRVSTNEVFHTFFEQLRIVIKNGHPDSGIPVLDPFKISHQDFSFFGNYVSLKANVSDVEFSGLGSFQILPFTFNPNELSIILNISFPLLTLHSEHYEMQGVIYETIPLAGRGKLHFEVHELIVSGKVFLVQADDGKSVIIHNLINPDYTIKHIVSQTDYDENIDDILNAMVQEVLVDYLNRFSKYIASTYGNIMIDSINYFLQKLDTWSKITKFL